MRLLIKLLKVDKMEYNVDNKYKPFLYLIDSIGKVIFFWTKFRKFRKGNVKKILVIRLNEIGDLVLTTPVFKNLKVAFPKAQLHVLTKPKIDQILNGNKNIDKILNLNPKWLSRGGKASWGEAVIFARTLRRERYDLVVELHAHPINIVLAAFL